jgi:4'-phosphopantetheinyl transferase
LAELLAHLCPDERRHSTGLRNPNARDAFVVGRGMTRELLARHVDEKPEAIRIVASKSGKPDLRSRHSGIAFNLSHTGRFCALAVGNAASVGVDIETINSNIGDLTHSVFGRNEAAQFADLADARKTQAFFRAWVAKEAYLKATGEGLAGGLAALELDLTDAAEVRAVTIQGNRDAVRDWSFHGFDLDDRTVGAIAVRTAGVPLVVKTSRISAEDLTLVGAHQASAPDVRSVRSPDLGESS